MSWGCRVAKSLFMDLQTQFERYKAPPPLTGTHSASCRPPALAQQGLARLTTEARASRTFVNRKMRHEYRELVRRWWRAHMNDDEDDPCWCKTDDPYEAGVWRR